MTRVDWQANRHIPACAAAVLASLDLSRAPRPVPERSDSEWRAALYFADRNQLALLVRGVCEPQLPEPVRHRLDRDYAVNRERLLRMREVFREADSALRTRGIECVLLKGFAGIADYVRDPNARVQYDLDLYCPHHARAASDVLEELGYQKAGSADPAADHLPPLVRQTGWQWRGDFFDPAIPISIEIHHRLWDEQTEGLEAPGLDAFWERRVSIEDGPSDYLSLHPADAFAYKSLHALRHLLRGEFRAAHLYELGWFLHHRAGDDSFWSEWAQLHPHRLRALQAVMARMAEVWFGCRMHARVRAETDALPRPVQRWFDASASSAAESYFRPNKDELWLHLCLLPSWKAQARVVRRRLVPVRLPGPLDTVFLEPGQRSRLKWRKRLEYWRYASRRAAFHCRALLPTLSRMARMLRWYWSRV